MLGEGRRDRTPRAVLGSRRARHLAAHAPPCIDSGGAMLPRHRASFMGRLALRSSSTWKVSAPGEMRAEYEIAGPRTGFDRAPHPAFRRGAAPGGARRLRLSFGFCLTTMGLPQRRAHHLRRDRGASRATPFLMIRRQLAYLRFRPKLGRASTRLIAGPAPQTGTTNTDPPGSSPNIPVARDLGRPRLRPQRQWQQASRNKPLSLRVYKRIWAQARPLARRAIEGAPSAAVRRPGARGDVPPRRSRPIIARTRARSSGKPPAHPGSSSASSPANRAGEAHRLPAPRCSPRRPVDLSGSAGAATPRASSRSSSSFIEEARRPWRRLPERATSTSAI